MEFFLGRREIYLTLLMFFRISNKSLLALNVLLFSSCVASDCEKDANQGIIERPITVQVEMVDEFGISLSFENTASDRKISYSFSTYLYFWDDNSCSWIELQTLLDNIVVFVGGTDINPNETVNSFHDWTNIYGELKPGLYKIKSEFSYFRVVDSYGASFFPEGFANRLFDIYTEFTID